MQCTPGFVSPPGSEICFICPPGYKCETNATAVTYKLCEKGTYSPAGKVTCSPCQKNHFWPTKGWGLAYFGFLRAYFYSKQLTLPGGYVVIDVGKLVHVLQAKVTNDKDIKSKTGTAATATETLSLTLYCYTGVQQVGWFLWSFDAWVECTTPCKTFLKGRWNLFAWYI